MLRVKHKSYLNNVTRVEVDKDKSKFEWRLDQSERLVNFPDEFWDKFLSDLNQNDFICYPYVNKVKQKIAEHHNLQDTKNIFITPGTDVAIRTLFDVFVIPGSNVISTSPCFPMYDVYSKLYGAEIKKVEYNEKLTWSIDNLLELVDDRTSLIMIANPNNPLGDLIPKTKLVELFSITQEMQIPVLIDEAYHEFVEIEDSSCIISGLKFTNVICTRTFSKAKGGAGIRVGYVISNSPMINLLGKFRIMHEITGPASKFACYILDNYDIVTDYVRKTNSEKRKLVTLFEKSGYDILDGYCNWIHINSKDDNKKLCSILDKYKNVAYKAGVTLPFDDRKNWLRMTVGPTLSETNFIKELLENKQ